MANDMDTATDLFETEDSVVEQTAPPAAKTRKELKKERKELKKHKKQVAKEARMHSAKATRFNNFLMTVISIFVIVSMIFCSITAINLSKSIGAPADTGTEAPAGDSGNNGGNSGNSGNSTPSTPTTPSNGTGDAGNNSGDSGAAAPAGDLSTPAAVVEYYKTAHAKVLSSAKSVTRTYDNTINYKDVLDIDGNTTLAGVAKSLMGTFMKENTEELVYTGADMKVNFPAKNKGAAGLTADMVSEATAVDNGDTYTITIVIDSSEESPDLGDKSSNLVNTVDEKQVTDAAGSMVSLEGLENHYIAPKLVATVEKATGNITALETVVPSYMCFAKASVFVISVANCRIGLEYQQKWTVQW